MTSYIACYSIRLSLKNNGGDVVDPLPGQEFKAKDDKEALQIAENKRLVLELLENAKPDLKKDIERTVILTSVRNQYNKQMVFYIGRTET